MAWQSVFTDLLSRCYVIMCYLTRAIGIFCCPNVLLLWIVQYTLLHLCHLLSAFLVSIVAYQLTMLYNMFRTQLCNLCKILLLLVPKFTPRFSNTLPLQLLPWRALPTSAAVTSPSTSGTTSTWRLITFSCRGTCQGSWQASGLAPTRFWRSSTLLPCVCSFQPVSACTPSSMWVSSSTTRARWELLSSQYFKLRMMKCLRLRPLWHIVCLEGHFSFWWSGKVMGRMRIVGNPSRI